VKNGEQRKRGESLKTKEGAEGLREPPGTQIEDTWGKKRKKRVKDTDTPGKKRVGRKLFWRLILTGVGQWGEEEKGKEEEEENMTRRRSETADAVVSLEKALEANRQSPLGGEIQPSEGVSQSPTLRRERTPNVKEVQRGLFYNRHNKTEGWEPKAL